MTDRAPFSLDSIVLTACLFGCSASTPKDENHDDSPEGMTSEDADEPESAETQITSLDAPTAATPYLLPADYTPGDLGGWKLGAEITSETGETSSNCGNEVIGVVRDFRRGDPGMAGHPDFQTFFGSKASTGLVESVLVDRKPTYSGLGEIGIPPQRQMTSEERFSEWYTSDPTGTFNRTYEIRFSLEPNGDVRTFQSSSFYPLNGAGFGSEAPFVVNAGLPDELNFGEQNFHFTTEVHTKFIYEGGEVFSFSGDDDLWVFINDQLVLDLGGLHPELAGSVDIDSLGLSMGSEYPLDLFHAERGMPESNFRIDTSLEFTECFIVR